MSQDLLSVELPLAADEIPLDQAPPFDLRPFGRDELDLLTEAEGRIALCLRDIGRNIVSVGKKLMQVQEVLKSEGVFVHWLETRRTFRMSKTSAYRYMAVARTFPNLGNEELAHIDRSALYDLASGSVPPEIRARAIERAAAGERVTHAELQSEVRAWNGHAADKRDVIPDDLRRRMEVPRAVGQAETTRFFLNSALNNLEGLIAHNPRKAAAAIDPETKEVWVARLMRVRGWIGEFLKELVGPEWHGTSSEPLVEKVVAEKEAKRLLTNHRRREARKARKAYTADLRKPRARKPRLSVVEPDQENGP